MKEVTLTRRDMWHRDYKDIPFLDMIVYEAIEEQLGTEKFTILDHIEKMATREVVSFVELGAKDPHRIQIEEYYKNRNRMKNYFNISDSVNY